MRKYHLLAVMGTLLLVAGFALLTPLGAVAQDEPSETPPYLAEYYNAWVNSGHADLTAEAFTHWDEEGEIEANCATCHSGIGYHDFLGVDGSNVGTIDNVVPLGTTVTCDTCHAPVARDLTEVTFPSGVTISDDGGSARCMVCHQGRASTDTVNAKIVELNLSETPDEVSADLGFINIHYYAAAASLYGSEVRGGYQYEGELYQMRNYHVEGYQTCADCHDSHSLELKIAECATCHEDVETAEDLQFIRMAGSGSDYDGDGDVFEGISEEITGLQEMLYSTIQEYATQVAGTSILYSSASYPYWFIDTNANNTEDEGEIAFPNRYVTFTPNLLRAAYNYQVSLKDPGGYAHNPQYHIQLLHDAIVSLSVSLEAPELVGMLTRNDPGHFNTTAQAFRNWDSAANGMVPATCARCHSATGLPTWVANTSNIMEPISNSLECSTCHNSVTDFTLYELPVATFPSGAKISFAPEGENDPNNLCLACHQGRESTVSVNNAIRQAGVGDDEISDKLSFRNIHYFAAGATLFGGESQGAYQYADKDYVGRNMHDGEEAVTCTDCHDAHTGENDIILCQDCHESVESADDLRLIRMLEDVDVIDYDGDGNAEEPIAEEIQTMEDALLVAIQAYATTTTQVSIAYDSHSHPYWFTDTNGNGVADPDEVNRDNRYMSWTPTLLRAAYNYQYIMKDPGVYAHNPKYALQVLFDSLEALGGSEAVASYTRPAVE